MAFEFLLYRFRRKPSNVKASWRRRKFFPRLYLEPLEDRFMMNADLPVPLYPTDIPTATATIHTQYTWTAANLALPIADQKLWAALVPLADTPVDPSDIAGFTSITNQAGKVLIIHGTEGNDQIVVRRTGNDVRIDGFTGAINQTELRFIAIYSYGGNDVIRLDSETHPGQETLPVPAVVHAGAGDDVIVAGKWSNPLQYDVLDGGSGSNRIGTIIDGGFVPLYPKIPPQARGELATESVFDWDSQTWVQRTPPDLQSLLALPVEQQQVWAGVFSLSAFPNIDANRIRPFDPAAKKDQRSVYDPTVDDVLVIYGTERSDEIVVRQINNGISVDGFSGEARYIGAQGIRFIAIFTFGGDDVIRLDSERGPNGTQEALSVRVLVEAGAGNDLIVNGAGLDWDKNVLDGGAGTNRIFSGGDRLNAWMSGPSSASPPPPLPQLPAYPQLPTAPPTAVVANTYSHEEANHFFASFDDQKMHVYLVPIASTGFAASIIRFPLMDGGPRDGNVLYIAGTDRNDSIILRRSGDSILVDGFQTPIPIASVRVIAIFARDGHDVIRLDAESAGGLPIALPVLIQGGGGNDTIVGTGGLHANRQVIQGDGGNDHIIVNGGGEENQIRGGDGNDVIIGGRGLNRLLGGRGHDTLVSGSNPQHNDVLAGMEGHDTYYVRGNEFIIGNEWASQIDLLIDQDRPPLFWTERPQFVEQTTFEASFGSRILESIYYVPPREPREKDDPKPEPKVFHIVDAAPLGFPGDPRVPPFPDDAIFLGDGTVAIPQHQPDPNSQPEQKIDSDTGLQVVGQNDEGQDLLRDEQGHTLTKAQFFAAQGDEVKLQAFDVVNRAKDDPLVRMQLYDMMKSKFGDFSGNPNELIERAARAIDRNPYLLTGVDREAAGSRGEAMSNLAFNMKYHSTQFAGEKPAYLPKMQVKNYGTLDPNKIPQSAAGLAMSLPKDYLDKFKAGEQESLKGLKAEAILSDKVKNKLNSHPDKALLPTQAQQNQTAESADAQSLKQKNGKNKDGDANNSDNPFEPFQNNQKTSDFDTKHREWADFVNKHVNDKGEFDSPESKQTFDNMMKGLYGSDPVEGSSEHRTGKPQASGSETRDLNETQPNQTGSGDLADGSYEVTTDVWGKWNYKPESDGQQATSLTPDGQQSKYMPQYLPGANAPGQESLGQSSNVKRVGDTFSFDSSENGQPLFIRIPQIVDGPNHYQAGWEPPEWQKPFMKGAHSLDAKVNQFVEESQQPPSSAADIYQTSPAFNRSLPVEAMRAAAGLRDFVQSLPQIPGAIETLINLPPEARDAALKDFWKDVDAGRQIMANDPMAAARIVANTTNNSAHDTAADLPIDMVTDGLGDIAWNALKKLKPAQVVPPVANADTPLQSLIQPDTTSAGEAASKAHSNPEPFGTELPPLSNPSKPGDSPGSGLHGQTEYSGGIEKTQTPEPLRADADGSSTANTAPDSPAAPKGDQPANTPPNGSGQRPHDADLHGNSTGTLDSSLSGGVHQEVDTAADSNPVSSFPGSTPAGDTGGMAPKHFEVVREYAKENELDLVVRTSNPNSIQWIEKGYPSKGADLKIHTDPQTGLVTATNAAEATAAREAGYFVVDADGVPRNLFGEELKLPSNPEWPLQHGQVIDEFAKGGPKPVTGDYDLAAGIDPQNPSRNLVLATEDGIVPMSVSNPLVNKVRSELNEKVGQQVFMHGADDAYRPLDDAKTVVRFNSDGTVDHLTNAEYQNYFDSIGRKSVELGNALQGKDVEGFSQPDAATQASIVDQTTIREHQGLKLLQGGEGGTRTGTVQQNASPADNPGGGTSYFGGDRPDIDLDPILHKMAEADPEIRPWISGLTDVNHHADQDQRSLFDPSKGQFTELSSRGIDCTNTALATDALIAGQPASALPMYKEVLDKIDNTGGHHWFATDDALLLAMEGIYKRDFETTQVSGLQDIVDIANQATVTSDGNIPRGLVFIEKADGSGHVLNFAKTSKDVYFVDGQLNISNTPGKFAPYILRADIADPVFHGVKSIKIVTVNF